jgi:RHS repeat-associated protein
VWNFGDGFTSTLENPVHVYTATGVYTVSLTASGATQDTLTRTSYINVNDGLAKETVIRYTYDPLYRLTAATYSGAYTYTFAYGYDAVGNRTVQTRTITSTLVTTYTYDAANRLATQNGQSLFAWDANGNLLADGGATYAYDFANRIISATVGGANTQYAYNGDGARLRQIINAAAMTYTLDLAAPLVQVLVQKDGSGMTRYLYGVTRVGEQQSAGWVYHLPDALGSVRQLANVNSSVTLARGYTPYGEALWSQGTGDSAYGFTGNNFDASIGLLYLRTRYMRPALGVFLSRDQWPGEQIRPGSMNGWNYVEGNPVLFVDPSGRFRWCDSSTGKLALINAAHIVAMAPNAAEKLIRLFEDKFDMFPTADWCAGTIAGDRLAFVLDFTRGFDSDHYGYGLPIQFGVDFGGDCGFAEELRDSKYYALYPTTWGLHGPTNQPGHFLTAVAAAYWGPGLIGVGTDFFGWDSDYYNNDDLIPSTVRHNDYVALRYIIGHEKISDDARRGLLATAALQYLQATNEDIHNFLTAVGADERGYLETRDDYLQTIMNIQPGTQGDRVGNSIEDFRLTVKGWRFGKWVRANWAVSHREAALWLRHNIE